MNRIVLIGNGFDIAHGLKTRYEDFLIWYIKQKLDNLICQNRTQNKDCLCTISRQESISLYPTDSPFIPRKNFEDLCSSHNLSKYIEIENFCKNSLGIDFYKEPFFQNITNSVATKGWVDIENEYYRLLIEYSIKNNSDKSYEKIEELNKQLQFLQAKLIEYLKCIDIDKNTKIDKIKKIIYAPIIQAEIANKSNALVEKYLESCFTEALNLQSQEPLSSLTLPYTKYKFSDHLTKKLTEYENIATEEELSNWKRKPDIILEEFNHTQRFNKERLELSPLFGLPDQVMLLSFNYTTTALNYKEGGICKVNYIHGELNNLDNSIIFGYGDELDKYFKELKEYDNNKCLDNVKSIKYLETDNYKNILEFIESGLFQIYIMGHSCGNSDRTLLNTLFEHENCISIKPYYYQKDDGTDNYTELIQNISRNFTDMKLMRDRVVNKTYCKPLPQSK